MAVLLFLTAGAARAEEGTPRARAEASCARAEAAARELGFAEALEAYRAAIEIDPSAPCARVARARADDLAAHAEGGFAPLRELTAFRRDPRKAADRAAVEALERDLAAFPPGRVRAEARLLLAEAWARHLGDPGRAIAAFEGTIADPEADGMTRETAISELWALGRERGDIGPALAAVERDPKLSPKVTAAVHRAARRGRARLASTVALGALAAIGAAAIARLALAARDVRALPSLLLRPLGVAFALYLGAAGAVLVRIHGDGDARPFLWMGLGVLALTAIARALPRAIPVRSAVARGAWATACVVGVVAAGFLALERTDPSYLEGIGL